MLSIISSSLPHSIPLPRWGTHQLLPLRRPRRFRLLPRRSPSSNKDSAPLEYNPGELPDLDAGIQSRTEASGAAKLRSWFGPNGQYIRELPCPSCRGRGYTPCTGCGIERSRADCSECNGKGIRTCRRCLGDCVIWEESIDERPWEKARSRSPLKVKEDDEVDKLEIKLAVTRKSNRIYQSTSPEVISKISRSLRSLNAKTGLFSKRMKIIHKDPILHAQRLAAIKKAKRTDAARMQASEAMKTFFSNPENRLKRSIAMKGVKFFCRCCGDEGHRSHYCPTVLKVSGELRFKCRLCGERGHNRRTCGRSQSNGEEKAMKRSSFRHCRACGRSGHNRRTCSEVTQAEIDGLRTYSQKDPSSTNRKRTYTCKLCSAKGHNIRTCPERISR